MKRLICCLLLTLTVLSACTSYKSLMKSWVGASEQELVAKWGEPASVVNYEGTKIYTYEKYWTDTDKVQNRGRLKFVIDSGGTVINWDKTNFPDYLFGKQEEDLSRE